MVSCLLVFIFLHRQSSPEKERSSSTGISRSSGQTSDSFRNYWESVNDAWECEDDEFTSLAGKLHSLCHYLVFNLIKKLKTQHTFFHFEVFSVE
jgi:hypothetical protein